MPHPTIGRTVLYSLTKSDVSRIERLRIEVSRMNPHAEGQKVPLTVVLVWPNEYGDGVPGVNGQAILDGEGTLWVTSAKEGTEPGQWSWPEIVTAPPAPKFCDICPHNLALHNPDGSCGCGMDCARERTFREALKK
jgi:hypothetical protein